MEIYLKTSLAQRDEVTGKLTVHHAGDRIIVKETMGQRMVAMDLARPVEKPEPNKPVRKRKAGD